MDLHTDGGPAFPTPWTNDGDLNATAPDGQVVAPGGTVRLLGMSKRDAFALQVLPTVMQNFWKGLDEKKYDCPDDWRDGVSRDAVLQADALLRALSEPRPEPEPKFPEFNVYAANDARRDAVLWFARQPQLRELPAEVRSYIEQAAAEVDRVANATDDIPF